MFRINKIKITYAESKLFKGLKDNEISIKEAKIRL